MQHGKYFTSFSYFENLFKAAKHEKFEAIKQQVYH